MPSAVGVSDGRVRASLKITRPDGGTKTGHHVQPIRQPKGGTDEGLAIIRGSIRGQEQQEGHGRGMAPLEDSRQRTAQRLRNFPPLVFRGSTSEHSGARDPHGFQSGGPEDWGTQTVTRAGKTVVLDCSFFLFARFFG